MFDYTGLKEAVIKGDNSTATELVKQALQAKETAETILTTGLIPAMGTVGEKFQKNELYIPEMLISARAMKQSLELLEPSLAVCGYKPKATYVIGTVQGDLHDIGKNLVAMMLKGNGYDVIDLEVDVKPEQFVEAINEHQPQIVGLSALLTTTMKAMEGTIGAIKDANLDDQVKIMIGGAPITQGYADKIGAHAYAADAGSAVKVANSLLPK